MAKRENSGGRVTAKGTRPANFVPKGPKNHDAC